MLTGAAAGKDRSVGCCIQLLNAMETLDHDNCRQRRWPLCAWLGPITLTSNYLNDTLNTVLVLQPIAEAKTRKGCTYDEVEFRRVGSPRPVRSGHA